MIVTDDRDQQVEVATFSSDVGSPMDAIRIRSFMRPPPKKNVKRRDFTINLLYLNLKTGDVRDFVGGRDDLRAGSSARAAVS